MIPCVMRGPMVYCLESPDLPADVKITDCKLSPKSLLQTQGDEKLPGGFTTIKTDLSVGKSAAWTGLYRPIDADANAEHRKVGVQLIPYFAWANRGKSEMTVWIPTGD